MEDFSQAKQSLLAYVALEPDRGNGWLELGLTELTLGQPQDAIVSLTRAIERLPGEARPLAGAGHRLSPAE
jgi:cytochrome c-type biogenesis protein CcmH/NrfG